MIGDTIRMLRVSRGATQQELAEAIGVSLQAVQSYESNIWCPGTQMIRKMADYFCITIQEIQNGYSFLVDDEQREISVVRHMGGNRIRVISRMKDNCGRIE